MTQQLQITTADLHNINKELSRRSLVEYIELMWPVLEPSTPFVYGWHLDAVADHLAAVTRGELTRLIINEPPGMMKSLEVGVFWPTWEWGPQDMPHLRYLGTSHNAALATRDNVKARRIVESNQFQQMWPIELVSDQNAKTKFENKQTGFREAMAITSMTGSRGDRLLIDDPHSVDGSESQTQREATCELFFEGVQNRLNNPDESAIVIVMQRLHERDLSGQILARDLGYEHLMLPMEFERERKCVTSIGFEDPRTEEGELLFPERFSREIVENDKRAYGQYSAAGQLQQRPAPREGGLFKVDAIKIVDWVEADIVRRVRYWDKAGTDDDGKYTAGVLMALLSDQSYLVEDVIRGQWSMAKRERNIRAAAKKDGVEVEIWMEQEPGSAGKDVATLSIKNLAGFVARSDVVSGQGAKEVRALPFSAQMEIGNVLMIRAPWNDAYKEELRLFPRGQYADQTDASSGAFNKLTLGIKVPDLTMDESGKQANPHNLGAAA